MNLRGCQSIVIGFRLAKEPHLVPSPIGREDNRQPRHVGAVVPQSGRIRIGERLGDTQADMTGAPVIGKTHVQQMRGQSELRGDPGSIQIAAPIRPFMVGGKESLCDMIAAAAQGSPLFSSDDRGGIVAIVRVKRR